MRSSVLALFIITGLVPALPAAAGIPAGQGKAFAAPVSNIVPIAHKCPKGQYWVPAGYAKHGKYRAAHCAPK